MPPANDNFASATTLTGDSGSVTFSNVGATLETGEPHSDADGHTVWFKFTTGSNYQWGFRVVLSTSATPLPDWDSVIDVYTGSSLTGLTLVGHDDDDGLQPGATDPDGYGTSQATVDTKDELTYYVRVDSYDTYGTRTDAVLTWTITPLAPYGPGTAAGPWLSYSDDEQTPWLSGNVIAPDGTEWVTSPSVGFARDAVTFQDSGGTIHNGPFNFDPTGSPTHYARINQRRELTIRLSAADIGAVLLFNHDYSGEPPSDWFGGWVEFELPDGTITTNPDGAVGALRDDLPYDFYMLPAMRLEVQDPASTPYSDSEFSDLRSAGRLSLSDSTGTAAAEWTLPTSWTLIGGPSPAPDPVLASWYLPTGADEVVFNLAFTSLAWTGHFTSFGGQWGLQGADGGVVSYVDGGAPQDMGADTAPSTTDDVVAWRVHWRPPRYRFIISPPTTVEAWAQFEGIVPDGTEIWG